MWFKKKKQSGDSAPPVFKNYDEHLVIPNEAPPFMVSHEQNITVLLASGTHTIGTSHPNHGRILDAIRASEWHLLDDLVDVPQAVAAYSEGNIVVNEFGEVTYNGEPINNTVTERITRFYQDGLPFQPLVRFLERLMANPSKRAVDELYRFLENEGMPITEDGCFIGYKGLNDNLTDRYTGKIDNSPGQVVSMPRNEVDDDANQACSVGFHVGSQRYATNWGSKVMIVKVDPADAVSVPHSDAQKLRVCKYEVIREEENVLQEALFVTSAPVADLDGSEYDDDLDYLDLDDDDDYQF